MIVQASNFTAAYAQLKARMVTQGETVNVETWQGQDVRSRPDMVTTELFNVTVEVPLRGLRSLNHWRAEIGPNLPWADDHFAERVSGKPLNPPPSWAWWPWAQSAAKHRDPNEKFNHSYPERFWPKKAHLNWNDPMGIGDCALSGIHQEYGDLDDVVMLLRKDPQTRQAFFPIFFPEDTGVGDGGRKPCTLGYQFLRRGAQLHVVYSMRSCDLVRHYSDDVYLTVRLLLWVLEQCGWTDVKPGTFVMHMTSLHIFANDLTALQSEQSANLMKALS